MDSKEMVRVLLAEDDALVCEMVQGELAAVGYRVVGRAASGAEALALTAVLQPDVVLMDIVLPDMSGIEVIQRIYLVSPTPVVVLTDCDSLEMVQQAGAAGVGAYLVKPARGGEIARAIMIARARFKDLMEMRRLNLELQAQVLERQQAERELQQRHRVLDMLNRAGQALNSTLDLDHVLVTMLEEVRHLLGVVASSVWLIDPESGELVCRQASGPQRDHVTGWRLAPGAGISGWSAMSGESLIVSDAQGDKRHFMGVDEETGLDLHSILSVPLQVKKKVIGVLQVVDTRPNRFSAMDLATLEPLAATAALAIENARLFQETDRLRVYNQNIIRSLQEGILMEAADGRITFANSVLLEMLGYQYPEELLGKDWRVICAPQALVLVEQQTSQRLEGLCSRYETELITKDGRFVPVLISSRLLFEEARYVGTLSVFTDITERKRTEELSRRQRDLALLLSATVDLEQALQRCMEMALEISGLDAASIYLLDEVTNEIYLAQALGMTPEVTRFPAFSAPFEIFIAFQPQYMHYQEVGFYFPAGPEENLRAVGFIPILRYEERVVACMCVASRLLLQIPEAVRPALEGIAAQVGSVLARLKAEQALRESQARYRAVSELTSDYAYSLLVDFGERMSFEWVTDAFMRITGYNVAQVQELGGLEALIHPEDRAIFHLRCQLLIAGQTDVSEFRIITRQGEVRWLREHGSPVWDEGHTRVVRIFGAAQDVTERKWMEESLRESEERLRQIIQQMPYPMEVCTPDGLEIMANPAFLDQFGSLNGIGLIERLGLKARMAPVYEGFPVFLPEVTTVPIDARRGGEKEVFEVTLFPVFRPSGELRNVVTIWQEITERRRAEAALRRSEQRFRSLVESADDLIFVQDLPEGRYLLFHSPARYPLLSQDFEGHCPEDCLPPEVAALHREKLQQVAQERATVVFEEERDFRAQRFYFMTTLSPIRDSDGRVNAVVGISRDVSAQRRMQARIIQSDRLVIVGKLAASVAHEINNPLQSILGCLGLAQEALEEGREVGQYLRVARDEVRRIARIVGRMRNLYRPESGEVAPASANELLEEVLELSRKQCQDSQVEVFWLPEPQLPMLLVGADRIKQVFFNLLLNAIVAMPKGGQLQISTAYTVSPPGVRIEFADTGVGIDPEVLPHIFEPFFSTRSDGTGLGLSISMGIVEQYGGRIEAQSQLGLGSIFTIWLPAVAGV